MCCFQIFLYMQCIEYVRQTNYVVYVLFIYNYIYIF